MRVYTNTHADSSAKHRLDTHQVVAHEEVAEGGEDQGEDFGGGLEVGAEEDEGQGEEGGDDGAELFLGWRWFVGWSV